ncbi:MAG: hypothetical protein M5U19_08560 [Microthrixaceae bacterium]|nr:hypothetical protein [Microthrixaceae bacterium]
MGGSGDLPAMALSVTGPGEESGTYVSFVELALEDIATERRQPPETRADYQASADDNVILQGIQGSPGSLGWVGYAFARDAEEVRILEVDGGEGCVAPDDETIATGEYPLSRPLFIYVNARHAEDEPALVDFVDLYLGDAIGSVAEVGYVPRPTRPSRRPGDAGIPVSRVSRKHRERPDGAHRPDEDHSLGPEG